MAPGTYLVGGRLGWCYPKTQIHNARSSREGWARARGARGRRRLGRDCGDVCSVRESRTITLKVRRRASAGHSRVQRGESGLRRRSVHESGTIIKGGKAPPEAVSGRATYTTATANSAAISSRLGMNTVIFQTQSMLLQASRRVFP